MQVKRIMGIGEQLAGEMRQLILSIDDKELNVDAALNYINSQLQDNAAIGVFDDDNTCHGFVYVEKPNALYPTRGYLMFTCIHPTVKRHDANSVFAILCDWLKEQGADHVWGWTYRNTEVIARIYGFELAKEQQIRKELR